MRFAFLPDSASQSLLWSKTETLASSVPVNSFNWHIRLIDWLRSLCPRSPVCIHRLRSTILTPSSQFRSSPPPTPRLPPPIIKTFSALGSSLSPLPETPKTASYRFLIFFHEYGVLNGIYLAACLQGTIQKKKKKAWAFWGFASPFSFKKKKSKTASYGSIPSFVKRLLNTS